MNADHDASATAPMDPAAIRAALAECMTLADIEYEMGWAAGTALRVRWRPEPVGLPEPDHVIARIPLWFRSTFLAWRASRPGMGARSPQPGQAQLRRPAPPTPPAGYRTATDGLTVPRGDDVDVIAHVHGAWRPVQVLRYNRRSLTVRFHLLDDTAIEQAQGPGNNRVGISRIAVSSGPTTGGPRVDPAQPPHPAAAVLPRT